MSHLAHLAYVDLLPTHFYNTKMKRRRATFYWDLTGLGHYDIILVEQSTQKAKGRRVRGIFLAGFALIARIVQLVPAKYLSSSNLGQ